MMLNLKLRYARLRWRLSCFWAALRGKSYVVHSTPADFRRLLLRKHNQRRERGNVQLYLRQRRGRYHATS